MAEYRRKDTEWQNAQGELASGRVPNGRYRMTEYTRKDTLWQNTQ